MGLIERLGPGLVAVDTSSLTLLELLVVPYRSGNRRLAAQYEAVLRQGRGIRMVDISLPHVRIAAQLRAASKIKTPDALQLATALDQRCPVFLTNDRRRPDVAGLRVVTLAVA